MHDRAIWKTAPPLWRDALAGTVDLDRPALLRFDSDDFIERLQTALNDAVARDVGAFALRHETWKEPKVGLSTPVGNELPTLYQPIHGRHYLVSGGLVCERYGLPDKVIHPNCDESAFFVLRRLQPVTDAPVDPTDRSTFHEFGWVPLGSAGSWAAVATGLVDGEERLPLFPMTYLDGHRRRLLAGTIPVAAREKYEGALPPIPLSTTTDPVKVLALPGRDRLEAVVLSLEALLRTAYDRPQGDGTTDAQRDTFDARFLEAAYFALVDFAGFLVDELPPVWNGSVATGGGRQLADLLQDRVFRAGQSWMKALLDAYGTSPVVVSRPADLPGPVAGASVEEVVEAIRMLGPDPSGTSPSTAVVAPRHLFAKANTALAQRDTAAAEAAAAAASADAGPVSQPPPQPSRKQGAVYVTRLVYERPRCAEPHRLTVSAPSEPFRLAHFYDPDAPFRENRIVLPVDTSLAGLRKFPKAVKVELSAQLRKQVERVQAIKLSDLEDGNIPAEGGGSLGMICSLSIPIITICALILLMIIVSVLNIVFFWMPLFKICLPKADD